MSYRIVYYTLLLEYLRYLPGGALGYTAYVRPQLRRWRRRLFSVLMVGSRRHADDSRAGHVRDYYDRFERGYSGRFCGLLVDPNVVRWEHYIMEPMADVAAISSAVSYIGVVLVVDP
jgi:hypothetical protein